MPTLTEHTFPYHPSRQMIASLGTRLRDIFRTTENRIFSNFLKKDFLQDLKLATYLTSLSEEDITPEQQMDLSSLMDAYYPEGKCPSHLFSSVSKELQEEYRKIHDDICKVLYDKDMIQ